MMQVLVMYRKELLDILRDRRTLFLTLALPVVLYPGLLLAMGAMISLGAERLKNTPLVVAVVNDEAHELLRRTPEPPLTTYQRMDRAGAEALLRERKVAALVEVETGALYRLSQGGQAVVNILYTRRYDTSTEAQRRITAVVESLNQEELAGRLTARSLDAAFVAPVKASAVDLDFGKDLGPLIASRLLPMMLLMMLTVGAVYPAVDLTAGEKERGTLETLLVSAVTPFQVMIAKYFTVGTVAVLSAVANLASMGATFGMGLTLSTTPVSVSFSLPQLAMVFACLAPAALLLSGVALAVASTARTFKEGQSLMTPLVLVVLAPAFASQMPGVELSLSTSLVPLLNVALLVKATVLGAVQPLHAVLTVVTVVVSAGLALVLAASAFRSEFFRFGGMPGPKPGRVK